MKKQTKIKQNKSKQQRLTKAAYGNPKLSGPNRPAT